MNNQAADAQAIKTEHDDPRYVVAHPSRSAPLCKDCKHCLPNTYGRRRLCNHPTVPIDLCYGTSAISVSHMRCSGDMSKGDVKRMYGIKPCGVKGKLFELAPQPANPDSAHPSAT